MTVSHGSPSGPTSSDAEHATTRHRVAERLQRSSAKHAYDPEVDVDWEAPLVPGAFAKAPESCSLFGTSLWNDLSEGRRAELSHQEVAASAAAGIWFELMLMQGLVRVVYASDPTATHAQYALTEIADECRHSTMFAKAIEKTGGLVHRPSRRAHRGGKLFAALSGPALLFAGAIFVEELTDAMQREAMVDETIEPLVRMVSRIHVLEEARHISFAKHELAHAWRQHGPIARAVLRWAIAAMALIATEELVHPKAYTGVGLDPREARHVAATNPIWRARKARWAHQAVSTFEELGIIAGPSRVLWRRAGVLNR